MALRFGRRRPADYSILIEFSEYIRAAVRRIASRDRGSPLLAGRQQFFLRM
jgi:hypothetical protein